MQPMTILFVHDVSQITLLCRSARFLARRLQCGGTNAQQATIAAGREVRGTFLIGSERPD